MLCIDEAHTLFFSSLNFVFLAEKHSWCKGEYCKRTLYCPCDFVFLFTGSLELSVHAKSGRNPVASNEATSHDGCMTNLDLEA